MAKKTKTNANVAKIGKSQFDTAVSRLNTVYHLAIDAADLTAALGAQRELDSLYRLHGTKEDGDAVADAGAAKELSAVRGHLEPLGLGTADTPTAELARLAVQKIVDKPE